MKAWPHWTIFSLFCNIHHRVSPNPVPHVQNASASKDRGTRNRATNACCTRSAQHATASRSQHGFESHRAQPKRQTLQPQTYMPHGLHMLPTCGITKLAWLLHGQGGGHEAGCGRDPAFPGALVLCILGFPCASLPYLGGTMYDEICHLVARRV